MLHNLLQTTSASAIEHHQQFVKGHRVVVRIQGIWTRGQGKIDAEFDVIASTDAAIFVRRRSQPKRIYEVGHRGGSPISHGKLKVVRHIKAEHRIVKMDFDDEAWNSSLALEYPYALITGELYTFATPPTFAIDEFATIEQFGDKWNLTHAPIELVDEQLRKSNAPISGEIQIRYWRDKQSKDTAIFTFPLNF